MAESVSELQSKILRLQVRYDGMSDARVAEKKALEDQIRALRDQLDELRPPSTVDPQGVRQTVGHDAPPDDPKTSGGTCGTRKGGCRASGRRDEGRGRREGGARALVVGTSRGR
jgi:hypothetical protein